MSLLRYSLYLKQKNKTKMNLKCLFGFHKWKKYGGAENMGDGKFRVRLICERCKKIKQKIS